MHVPLGWERKSLLVFPYCFRPRSRFVARARHPSKAAVVQAQHATRSTEGRPTRTSSAESDLRGAQVLARSARAVHNDAEPFGVDEIYERLDHRLSRSHRAAARGGFAPTAKRRLGRVRTPAHSNGNAPRPPRELRPRETNRHKSITGA